MRRRNPARVWLLVALFIASLGSAPEPVTAAAADAGLAALDWLAGCWEGDGGEECWLAAGGGMMLGVNRSPEKDGRSGFEFLRIVEEEDGRLVYLASPSGRHPPTPFAAIEVGEQRVVFANPEHDFPRRIAYWLDEDGTLHARVEADGEGFELLWRRRGWTGE
ncbi:MAG: DUF6265 family protein [Thermoanaerobaculia bacterium]|nr:DUF6265 family protein [Thermoanaerobaculia bacterium]